MRSFDRRISISSIRDDSVPIHEVPRILVVEDYWLIAMHVQLMLEEQDCEVVGPVGTVEEALRLAHASDLSGAILDVNLGDCDSFAIADILSSKGVPFAFSTGYMTGSMPSQHQARPYFSKPMSSAKISRMLQDMGIAPAQLRQS